MSKTMRCAIQELIRLASSPDCDTDQRSRLKYIIRLLREVEKEPHKKLSKRQVLRVIRLAAEALTKHVKKP
jgi:hypothetical protein